MLLYSPEKRTKPIYLLGHPFFDELRDINTKLENGRNLPNLFNFNKTEMKIDPKFVKEKLIPDWYEQKNNNIFYLINNLNLITFIKMFAYKYFYSKILKIIL